MREGTLIVLNSDPDEVGLVAHRRFIPTSRPRDERIAHTAAWRGFTITDRRHEFAHRSHHIHSAHRRGESPSVEDLRGQRTIWSHDQEHTDGGCRTGNAQLTQPHRRSAHGTRSSSLFVIGIADKW